MTADERRANLDATLATIDATLAGWETDRREAWIDENLYQPGQLHVAIAREGWFAKWLDGEITDDEAQKRVDAIAVEVVEHRERYAGMMMCWLCLNWVPAGDETHLGCRWEDARKDRHDRPAVAALRVHSWAYCLHSDGTGWGAQDRDGDVDVVPPPEAELVDGVGLTVSPHALRMATFK